MFDANATFEEVVRGMEWRYLKGENSGRQHLDVLLEKEGVRVLYDHIKTWSYEKVSKIYMDKDSLIDDKVEIDGVTKREAKRDYLIQHLFKIQDVIYFYKNRMYNELLQKTQARVMINSDKARIKYNIEKLISMENESIESVIEFAHQAGLCVKDDTFLSFVEKMNIYIGV